MMFRSRQLSSLRRRRRRSPATTRLALEALEDRSLPSVDLGLNFAGLNWDTAPRNASPPDPIAAVGPAHVVEAVNSSVVFYDKASGAELYKAPTRQFFGSFDHPGIAYTDPRVIYDEMAGRFVIAVLQFNPVNPTGEDNLLLAVSDDADPTNPGNPHGAWEMHKIDNTENGKTWGDFPQAGYDADGIYISMNMYKSSGAFDHARLFTIDKASVLDNNDATFISHAADRLPPDFTMYPASMHGAAAGAPMYFVESMVPGLSNGSGGFVTVVQMTNKLSANPTFTDTKVLVPHYVFPPDAAQKDGATLDAGDGRILSAAWRDGRLVATQTTRDDTTQVAQARWYEFNTSGAAPTLTQVGQINQGSGVATFRPAIDIAPNGDLGMTFVESASSEYLSMYITGRKATDPAGTMQAPVLVKAGVAPLRIIRGGVEFTSDLRTGDYSSVSVDPLDGSFWAANEYVFRALANPPPARADNWATWIARFTISATPSPATAAAHGGLALVFEANVGQSDQFLSREAGYATLLTPSDTVISLTSETANSVGRLQLSGREARDSITVLDELLDRMANLMLE